MSELKLSREELATLKKVLEQAEKADEIQLHEKVKKVRSHDHLWAAVELMTEELKGLYRWQHRKQADLAERRPDHHVPRPISDRMNAILTLLKLQVELDRMLAIVES